MAIVSHKDASSIQSQNGERRERIINAAAILFSHVGFDKCTIRDIAKESSVPSSLIYYYFKSKEGLLRALIENVTDRFSAKKSDALLSLLNDSNLHCKDKLRIFLLESLEIYTNLGHLKTTILRTFVNSGEISDMLRERVWDSIQYAAKLIEDGRMRGELKDDAPSSADIAFQLYSAMTTSALNDTFAIKYDFSSTDKRINFVNTLINVTFDGIAANKR